MEYNVRAENYMCHISYFIFILKQMECNVRAENYICTIEIRNDFALLSYFSIEKPLDLDTLSWLPRHGEERGKHMECKAVAKALLMACNLPIGRRERVKDRGGGSPRSIPKSMAGEDGNDGILNRSAEARAILLSGLVDLVAGASSMAIGESASIHA
uniref:Uncharacterized protein n=1 Tax=Oryza nivara TaxID=4536 RepID=A0A0E0H0C3_ORYNI